MPCLKIDSVKEIPYAEERINLFLHFPHLLFDFGKIWCKTSVYSKAEPL